MRIIPLFMVCCLCIAIGTPAAALPPATQDQDETTLTPVIVVFANASVVNESAITAVGGELTGGEDVHIVPVRFARIPKSAIPILERQTAIVDVERDHHVITPTRISQTTQTNQTTPWGINRINASAARRQVTNTSAATIQIAVLDTGIDVDHEDLESNVVWGADTVGNDTIVNGTTAGDDVEDHGTHVAGTTAAIDNSYGVVGVSPHTELYAIRVLNRSGIGTESDLVEGIDAAVRGPDGTIGTSDDADVISLSLASDNKSLAIDQAVESAANHSVIVAAAGNSGDGDLSTNDVSYPAKHPEVIAVAATDKTDTTPSWSSEGAQVEFAAPGVDIFSTYSDDQYASISGTSMATPHVSGVIGLLLAKDAMDGNRTLTTDRIRALLADSSRDIGPPGVDNASGYGLIQAREAISGSRVNLTLSANRTTITVGVPVEFTLRRTDTDEQVGGTVSINQTRFQTNADGRFNYTFEQTGNVTVTASKQAGEFVQFVNTSQTIFVFNRSTGPNVVNDQPARDPDNDGLYEDITGDGAVNILDVGALLTNRKSQAVQNNVKLFDFNADGRVNIIDVGKLLQRVL